MKWNNQKAIAEGKILRIEVILLLNVFSSTFLYSVFLLLSMKYLCSKHNKTHNILQNKKNFHAQHNYIQNYEIICTIYVYL